MRRCQCNAGESPPAATSARRDRASRSRPRPGPCRPTRTAARPAARRRALRRMRAPPCCRRCTQTMRPVAPCARCAAATAPTSRRPSPRAATSRAQVDRGQLGVEAVLRLGRSTVAGGEADDAVAVARRRRRSSCSAPAVSTRSHSAALVLDVHRRRGRRRGSCPRYVARQPSTRTCAIAAASAGVRAADR